MENMKEISPEVTFRKCRNFFVNTWSDIKKMTAPLIFVAVIFAIPIAFIIAICPRIVKYMFQVIIALFAVALLLVVTAGIIIPLVIVVTFFAIIALVSNLIKWMLGIGSTSSSDSSTPRRGRR
ncbi:unnamed protein product [Orchesella dallaii]|uniref:ABC transmembrane type-1 domain-containing protein n=1 Tax=Orchesella dallaii TaxID=48710 RepID=A0ABP1RBP3_9HEXA